MNESENSEEIDLLSQIDKCQFFICKWKELSSLALVKND
jgi:hypothetical protein